MYGRQSLPVSGSFHSTFETRQLSSSPIWLTTSLAMPSILIRYSFWRRQRHLDLWVLRVVLGLALGPILEESFFRGCLLPVLARSLGTTFAVVLTALVFALFHSPANLLQWLLISGTGTAYGWLRVTSRSTTAAALAHAAYNLVLVLFARFSS